MIHAILRAPRRTLAGILTVALLGAMPSSNATAKTPAKREVAPAEKVQSLERRLARLDARVAKARKTMRRLKGRLLAGWNPDTVLEVVHENKLGKLFEVLELRYRLDGKVVRSLATSRQGFTRIFFGKVSPGKHRLTINMVVQGSERELSYVSGLKIAVQREIAFSVPTATRKVITASLSEASGLTPRLGRRFVIRAEQETKASKVFSAKELRQQTLHSPKR